MNAERRKLKVISPVTRLDAVMGILKACVLPPSDRTRLEVLSWKLWDSGNDLMRRR